MTILFTTIGAVFLILALIFWLGILLGILKEYEFHLLKNGQDAKKKYEIVLMAVSATFLGAIGITLAVVFK